MINTSRLDITKHPCFDEKARFKWGRIHLPIAPDCNIQCNFCNRKYHCINESRPGVTRFLLDDRDVEIYLRHILKTRNDISVVGIAGPGDPFSEPDKTLKVLNLVHNNYPHLLLCISTNGFNIYDYIDDLKAYNVTHVTVTVNAIDPKISEKIYSWVRINNVIYRGFEAARILISHQRDSIRKLKEKGFTVKVNTVVIPGVNTDHITDIAKEMAKMNVDIMNCIPLIPLPETPFFQLREPSKDEMFTIRYEAARYIPQMYHCRRCRADAIGLLCNRNKILKKIEYYSV